MFFNKINLNLKSFDIELFKSDILQKEFKYENNVYMRFYRLSNMDLFKQLHPESIFKIQPQLIRYGEIEGCGMVRPHTDPKNSVVLNYYVDSGDCTTYFFNLKSEHVISQDKSDTVYTSIYREEDLEQAGEFTAKNREAYLLNVSKIHSVYSSGNGIRKFISYTWGHDTNYNDVKLSLKEYMS